MALTKTGLTFVNGSAPALNDVNLNKIVDLTDDIVDVIETPSYSTETEETAEIISLNANATGKFDATVKGNTWTNSLTNGNFANGTTGWSSISASSMTVSNNVMSLTGNGTSASVLAAIYTTIPFTTGRKVFTYTMQRVTNSDCTQLALTIANAGGGSGVAVKNIAPTINTYYEMYGITTLSIDTTDVRLFLRHTYPDAATANGKIMEVDGNAGVFAIDMTALGIEDKTEAEMLEIVRAGYWEGTKSTDKSRVKVVGKNLFDGTYLQGTTISSNLGVEGDFGTTVGARTTKRIKCEPNATYTVSGGDRNRWRFEDKAGNKIIFANNNQATITTPSNAEYMYVYYSLDGSHENIQLEEGSTATPHKPYSKTQATCSEELNSLPNGVRDEWETDTGKITKNVEVYIPPTGDIYSLITSPVNVDYVAIRKPTGFIGYNSTSTIYDDDFFSPGYRPYVGGGYDNVSQIGVMGSSAGAVFFTVVVAKGTYANLAAAQTALAGTTIYYQLATPEISYTQPAILNAEPNGTVYVEPYVAEDETAQFYSSGITLDSAYPLASLNDIDEINKYNLVDGTVTPVDIADLTLASSTLITSSSAVDGEFYAVSYNYRNLSTIGTVEHSFGTNLKAQTNDNTEGLKLLDSKVNNVRINVKELDDEINNIYINQIYGTRW